MPKPVKIKKKKSFMFTTKHHSFLGVLGAIVGIISISALVGSIYISFMNRGTVGFNMGSIGFFAACMNIIGLFCGFLALNERDIHRWLPIASIVGNTLILAVWVGVLILGIQGV